MFQYLHWVSDLTGISPVARLLGIRMANYASYADTSVMAAALDAACKIDLATTLAWIGCDEDELHSAILELKNEGIDPLIIHGDCIFYSFPELLDPSDNPNGRKASDYRMTLYVIRATDRISKIGISKYPAYRLGNLQAANPSQALTMVWQFEGPSKIIRRVERQAHAVLAERAMGHEWFGVAPDEAIRVVTDLLAKAGAA